MDTSTLERLSREFQEILKDDPRRRSFLEKKEDDAQNWIDSLQELAAFPGITTHLRSTIFSTMIRLSKNSGRYPNCLVLQNVRKLGEHPVGGGGFGDVWRGTIGEMNATQLVCLKVVKIYLTSDSEWPIKEYLREAIVWKQLKHPNLLPFFGIFYLDDSRERLCLVSPWMDKGNLVQYLKSIPADAIDHILLVYDVASGLAYLHSMKIVHADLKAVNILITPSGRACIADFGLSRVSDTQALGISSSTSRSMGTARWLSPELLKDHALTSKESDIWAFACICYEASLLPLIYSGLVPFHEHRNDAAVAVHIIMGGRPSKPAAAPDILWTLMETCWTLEPSERPQVAALVQSITSFGGDSLIPAPSWDEALLQHACGDLQRRVLESQEPELVNIPLQPETNPRTNLDSNASGEGNHQKVQGTLSPTMEYPVSRQLSSFSSVSSPNQDPYPRPPPVPLGGSETYHNHNQSRSTAQSKPLRQAVPANWAVAWKGEQKADSNLKMKSAKSIDNFRFMSSSSSPSFSTSLFNHPMTLLPGAGDRSRRGNPTTNPPSAQLPPRPTNGTAFSPNSSGSPSSSSLPSNTRPVRPLPVQGTLSPTMEYSASRQLSSFSSALSPNQDPYPRPQSAMGSDTASPVSRSIESGRSPRALSPTQHPLPQPGSLASRSTSTLLHDRPTPLPTPPHPPRSSPPRSPTGPRSPPHYTLDHLTTLVSDSSSSATSPPSATSENNDGTMKTHWLTKFFESSSGMGTYYPPPRNHEKPPLPPIPIEAHRPPPSPSLSSAYDTSSSGTLISLASSHSSEYSDSDDEGGGTWLRPQTPSDGSTTFKWARGKLIGNGTYRRVYLAMNATTGEIMIAKQVVLPRTASDRNDSRQITVVQALKRESEMLKDLDHPHIVQYLGFEETQANLSIFLEYVLGGSIGSVLLKHGKLSEHNTISFTGQILSGLEYLHSKGILHRDLKADNILVEMSGICKISNFGISKHTREDDGAGTPMQGTVFWMAPEVVNPRRTWYNLKADIWSVGCMVLEMLAGTRPWLGDEIVAVMFKLYQEKTPPPVPKGVILSESADDFCRKCFAINPDERPSAAELRKHKYLELPLDWKFTGFS